MAIPSVKQFSNEPGGGILNALNAFNSYANANHLRKINAVKEEYAPLTERASAASKLAYANLLAPQFLAKAMNNPDFMANLTQEQKNMLKDLVYGAGTMNTGINSLTERGSSLPNANSINQLNSMPTNEDGSLSGGIKNAFNHFLNIFKPSGNQSQSKQQSTNQDKEPKENQEALAHEPQVGEAVESAGSGDPEYDAAMDQWVLSHEGKKEVAKGENAKIPEPEEVKAWARKKNGYTQIEIPDLKKNPMELEVIKAQKTADNPLTYEQRAGKYRGSLKTGEKLGELNAKAIDEIGHEQLQLSKTGTIVDRLIDDFTNPDFIALREDLPWLQDVQLKVAAHVNDPKARHLIGKIISDIESFKQSTVNSFKGQTLKREFDFADKLKPTENDTVYTALGKLNTLKAVRDISYAKNKLIKRFMKSEGMDLEEATTKADKMIDTKAIEKKVNELTEPTFEIKNKKTGISLLLTKSRAKELGFKHD